jgi:hypothetical protein
MGGKTKIEALRVSTKFEALCPFTIRSLKPPVNILLITS